LAFPLARFKSRAHGDFGAEGAQEIARMAEPGKSSLWASIAEALRFHRENWRFVASVAAAGALAHVAVMALLGSTLLVLPAILIVAAGLYAILTRAALSGAANALTNAPRDTLRTLGAGLIVVFIAAVLALATIYIAMSVLIAPYAEEAKALTQDQAGMQALLERAAATQPGVAAWAGLIGAALIFVLTSRFFFAIPASLQQGRVAALSSWGMTKGKLLPIMAARLILLGPALIFVGALQSLLGFLMGLGIGDPFSMMARARDNPTGFLVFFAGAQFLQIAIFTALEAGLSTALYRRHANPPA
jgi:hypothetical protein